MKAYLSIIFSVMMFSGAFAQKLRFSDVTNAWCTKAMSSPDNSIYFTEVYGYSSDTVMYGQTYHKLTGGYHPAYFIKEDTTAGIVYYRDSDTSDHVLYNYNLHIGDSISYPGYFTDSVADIDSILIASLIF